jgi:hypothetical protein
MLWGEGFFLGFSCFDSLHGAIKVNTFEVCFGKLYQLESNVETFSLLKFYYYVNLL